MITDIRSKRQADILSAAADEFSKNGFERTKMEDIARKAGIGKSTIYEYFPSKIELLTAVLEGEFRCVNEDFERHLNEPIAFREKMTSMLGRTGDFFLGTLRTLINMPGSEPTVQFMREHGEKERDFVLALLEKNVERAIAQGEIRPDIEPKFAAMLFFVLLMTAGNHILLESFDWESQVKAVDYLFEGLGPHAKSEDL